MWLSLVAAEYAAAMSTAVPAHAGGEWPNGPNKPWFEDLQRPDNHLEPYRNTDPKSLFCFGIADTVKAKLRVEPGTGRYLEDRSHAWLKDEWVLVPPEKIVPDMRPTAKHTCSCSPTRSSASCGLRAGCDDARHSAPCRRPSFRRRSSWGFNAA